MIIHQPEISIKNGEVKVSSHVELAKPLSNIPTELWFSFSEQCVDYVTDQCDGFLTSLIYLAMYLGEDVKVRGRVSPKLAFNMKAFQRIHHLMLPDIFSRVDIKYNELAALPSDEVKSGVGTSFSGGIDSSFVIWNHHNNLESNPEINITHGVFIHGYDIKRQDNELFDYLFNKYSKLFKSWSKNLLWARSNFMDFTQYRIDWLYGHNGLQIGTAQVLGKLFKRFYKPGGDELIDGHVAEPGYHIHLLSTDSMEIGLHAPYLQRIDKLARMSDWEDIHTYLRVCQDPDIRHGEHACNNCIKCINTLIYLELLDLQPKFVNFEKPLSLWMFIRFILNQFIRTGLGYYRDHITRYGMAAKRYDIVIAVWIFWIPSEIGRFLVAKAIGLIPRKIKYRIKRKIYL